MNPINLVVLSAPTLFGSSQPRSLSCFYPARRIARSSWSLGERLFLFTCIVTCVRQGEKTLFNCMAPVSYFEPVPRGFSEPLVAPQAQYVVVLCEEEACLRRLGDYNGVEEVYAWGFRV